MNKNTISVLAKFSIVIFVFLIIYYFAAGIRSVPWEGDSIDYHIPIAKMIVEGHIISPTPYIYNLMQYCPGSSELILAVLMFLKVPINIYNVIGSIGLFFALKYLAKTFKLSFAMSVIFAVSFVTLHGVIRWINAQTIDIWLATFFSLSLALIQSPKKTLRYFLLLGLSLGMVTGSKYVGPAFTVFLLLIYGKNILSKLSIKYLFVFSIFFLVFGASWYIRNYFLTGDPYYPQSILFFKGVEFHILDQPVWRMFLMFPKVWFDAFISEYTVWSLSLVVVPVIVIFFKQKEYSKLLILGALNFAIYFFLPSGPFPNLITSGFRYTYPAFIPLILLIFMIAQKFKKETELAIIALTNMVILPEISYHPKILILLIPIALIIFRFLKVEETDKFVEQKHTRKGR
jgi:hypothetical protein